MPYGRTLDFVSRMAAQLDSCLDPALIVDDRYLVVAANDAFRARYAPYREVIGLPCFDVVHGYSRPCATRGVTCPNVAARTTGRQHRAVHMHTSPSGACCTDVLARLLYPRCRSRVLLMIRPVDEVSLQPSGDKLAGCSRRFCSIVEQMRRVAPTDRPVLLVGEAGSGKELVARTIHAMSGRRRRPFVGVDCARASDLLAQADLFGSASGDAEVRIEGGVAAAEGGTLFLHDLDGLPAGLQGPVLRLIESGTCRAAATAEERRADVRVICSVEHPPGEAVATGRLREDLAGALANSITVPPLRARRGDIPLLVASLLKRFTPALPRQVHPQAMALLRRYRYPGNVRELAAILEHASLAATGNVILPEHLPEHVRAPSHARTRRARP